MTPETSTSISTAPIAASEATGPITLAIDIGGSGLKAMLLDPAGKPVSERQRVVTPAVPTPEAVLRELDELRELLPDFDRVSVGFPGVVKHGVTFTAVNLHPEWAGFPLQEVLSKRWKKPVRVGNDADVPATEPSRATASSWCSRWAPAWARPSLPTATSAPVSNWATTPGARRA